MNRPSGDESPAQEAEEAPVEEALAEEPPAEVVAEAGRVGA